MAAAGSDDDANELSDGEAYRKLRKQGYPGANPQISIRNFQRVMDCYWAIREHGRRTMGQLLECAPTPVVDAPEKGLFIDQREWLSEVAQPALSAMPDIDAPGESSRDWDHIDADGGLSND